ncbi:MAG TPA: sugar phosphate isomerase/epimerase [Anaerolineae bacterium]|nr:sugar phosphate isomerase/epimerase [Anaerolineae bacterium]
MKLSVSTGTLYIYPLRAVFRWARQAGFDGLEVVVNPQVIARGGEGVRRLAAAEGLPIFSVHPTVVPLPGWRERHGGAAPTIRLACEAGAPVVVMHTPRAASLDAGEGLAFRRRIETWGAWLAGTGTRLAVENKAVRRATDLDYALTPLDRLRAFADQYDVDLVLDTAHAGSAGDDLLAARRVFGSRLANVHLSDLGPVLPLAPPRLAGAVADHLFPGAGSLPLAGLMADLAHGGYEGPVTLELNPLALHFWWPPAIRRHLARAARWMRSAS